MPPAPFHVVYLLYSNYLEYYKKEGGEKVALSKSEIFRMIANKNDLNRALQAIGDHYTTLLTVDDANRMTDPADTLMKEIRNRIEKMDATIKAWMDAGSYNDEQKAQLKKEYMDYMGKRQ